MSKPELIEEFGLLTIYRFSLICLSQSASHIERITPLLNLMYLEEDFFSTNISYCFDKFGSLRFGRFWEPGHGKLYHLNLSFFRLSSSIHQICDLFIKLLPFLSLMAERNLDRYRVTMSLSTAMEVRCSLLILAIFYF